MMNTIEPSAFRFSTKAGNLSQLRGRLSTARIMEQETVSVGDWRRNPQFCISRLRASFGDTLLIMRSSAPGEDSAEASMAGAFESILNVKSSDDAAVSAAIGAVVESYAARRSGTIDAYEVLVQPMVPAVRASGVVFTRDLDKGGPYYLVNYDDETDRTDSVTGGSESTHKVVRIYRGVDAARLDSVLQSVVLLARELEQMTGLETLDIEFAIDREGTVYLLQVRPLAQTRIMSYQRLDAKIGEELRHAREFVEHRTRPRPHLFGPTTVFGEMPDWNPAEIIGTHPKPLAASLYSFIIMKSVWRQARNLVGYRHPFPYQLLVEICGRPYVDVGCSFNSFIPATLRADLAEKLVDHYLRRLREHPELHDKVEFEIVLSSLDFSFDTHADRLRADGFSEGEIGEIRHALLSLTDSIVRDQNGVLARLESDVARLESRRATLLAGRGRAAGLPSIIEHLLEDCIEYGTLPFSVFARNAFIANAFLRSLVQRGVMTPAELDHYLHSIQTVAGDFVQDLERCKRDEMPLEDFLARYGHLRPGTYDVCAFSYAERPEVYLGAREAADRVVRTSEHRSKPASPEFPVHAVERIEKLLREFGFGLGADQLNRFVVKSIQLREAVKFDFTKNLSTAMTLLVDFAAYHGLSRESLSFLPIQSVLGLANCNASADWLAGARETIERNRNRYALTAAINLPDLIFGAADLEVISLQRRRPNFVTQKRVVAQCVRLDAAVDVATIADLSGAIVLIENADPGFDWLFARNIGGLITKYGGAASHMTIRCAELGLPAAIGCGEQIFNDLENAARILLDCAEKRVEPNAL